MTDFPQIRLRRLRYNPKIRDLVQENHLALEKMIMPLFVKHGKQIKEEISAMPGIYQHSLDKLLKEVESLLELGIRNTILFGLPQTKDACGNSAVDPQEIIPRSLEKIKATFPEVLLVTDLCFCEYTSHGHCGILDKTSSHRVDVHNDATLPLLVKQAVIHAQAGADLIAPSGMMDGMVQAIRTGLDQAGFERIPIMSYAAKYASSLYGPFRMAVASAPSEGDRQSYQMDRANANQALRETELDIREGADMVMVKPASFYLDIIQRVKRRFPNLPLAAFSVSGEYAMIKAVSALGHIDETQAMLEQLLSIKRAGADIIITYFAKQYATWLKMKEIGVGFTT